ncbi:hypothetical protein BN2156_05474 [Mycolicibacterium neworleansense]|uniref:Uncharacterized protein n=2 Tax=Mycolicibacterium neworleansense TaxID=146018 RepID=A0A0H5RWR9_9MYCO|nr:hypothetical protein BN2156_05474 [Mycolicibacterium neworleansense]
MRALLGAWYAIGSGLSTGPLRYCHSIFNLVALTAVTVAFFTGAALLGRRNTRGRLWVIAGSAAAIVLTVIELAVWPDLGRLGAHRWGWFALSIITLIVGLLARTESLSAARVPDASTSRAQRGPRLLVAALAVAMAVYHLWLAKKQFDLGWPHITGQGLMPTSPGATWALAMFEPLVVSVVAAAVLLVGAILISFRAAAGRSFVIAGCIITVAQGIFGWTDLDRLFYEIGATDLTAIFAPRSASVVVLTLTAPVVTAVLAAAAPAHASELDR